MPNDITIELNSEDISNLRSTFEARLIRMNEWLSKAKKEKNQKDIDIWTFQIAEKKALLKKISSQVKKEEKAQPFDEFMSLGQ